MPIAHRIRRALRRATALAALVPAAALHAQTLTLAQAIAMAQKDGSQARAALATRESARQHDRAFNARLLPQLSLNGTVPNYNRSITQVQQPDGTFLYTPQTQTNGNLALNVTQQLPLTGGSLIVGSSLTQTQLSGNQQFKSYNATPFSVQLVQPIFQANEQRWADREQSLSIEIAERMYLETRELIAVQTTGAFFEYYAARLNLSNSKANAAVNDTLYNLNKGRLEVGKIGENDLLQSELALLRARAAVDQAQLEHDRSLSALRVALNLAKTAPLEIIVDSNVPNFDVDTLVAIQQALRNQSVIRQNEFSDVDARRRIAEAQLTGGPNANVIASYGVNQQSAILNDAYRNPLDQRALSIRVSAPLFLWGAHSADVQSAKATREQVASNIQLSLANVEQNVRFTALGYAQARRALLISAKADTVGAKRYEVAYNRYVIGRITYDQLYLAQQEKDAALASYVSALRNYWVNFYTLRQQTLYDFEKRAPIR